MGDGGDSNLGGVGASLLGDGGDLTGEGGGERGAGGGKDGGGGIGGGGYAGKPHSVGFLTSRQAHTLHEICDVLSMDASKPAQHKHLSQCLLQPPLGQS